MNIKKVTKKANLEEKIRAFSKIIPLSICIKDENNKTILSFSDDSNETFFNYPITFNGKAVGELKISKKSLVADFVLHQINDAFVKERQIADTNDETLLLYREINLLYDLFKVISNQTKIDQRLNFFLEECVNYLQVGRASIWIIEGNTLRCTHYKGFKPVKIFKLGEGFIGQIAMSENAEMLNCPINDHRWEGSVNNKLSVVSSPLISCDGNIGVLHLCRHDGYAFRAKDLKLANVFAHKGAQEIEINKLIEKVKSEVILRTNFSRFMSPNIVELFTNEHCEVSLGGENRIVSVLFSDIVNFTRLSENMKSDAIVEMLNEYFTYMTEIVFSFDGTLDKFIGDEIMAFYGAPNYNEDHAFLAVRTGLLMQKKNEEIQYNRRKKGKPNFQIRIGINTGVATIGNIGAPNRLDYTAIGDVVNIASRIENNCPPGEVLIGETTYELVKNSFSIEKLDNIMVKGKTNSLKIYKILEEY
jgi:class 3 adenylate cyclase